ncbi:unnamed protein product, partial [Polarella glacialis]
LPPGMPPPGTLPASCGYLNSLQGLSGPQGFPPAPLGLTPAGEEPKWEKLFDFLGQPAPPQFAMPKAPQPEAGLASGAAAGLTPFP